MHTKKNIKQRMIEILILFWQPWDLYKFVANQKSCGQSVGIVNRKNRSSYLLSDEETFESDLIRETTKYDPNERRQPFHARNKTLYDANLAPVERIYAAHGQSVNLKCTG